MFLATYLNFKLIILSIRPLGNYFNFLSITFSYFNCFSNRFNFSLADVQLTQYSMWILESQIILINYLLNELLHNPSATAKVGLLGWESVAYNGMVRILRVIGFLFSHHLQRMSIYAKEYR